MEPTKPQRIVLMILGVFMLLAWALIIWVGVLVTQSMIETLQYIVDLAQLS